MPAAFDPSILRPGDAILYFRRDFVSWIVALKTWTKVAHVEIYRGEQISLSSRTESGVNSYPLRMGGVAAVMRPKLPLDWLSADIWFESIARGQPYDWLGLLCFELFARRGERSKMFCSEFATRFYRAAGLEPFNSRWPAVRVPPSFFLVSPVFETVWTDKDWF